MEKDSLSSIESEALGHKDNFPLLSKIDSPAALKAIPVEQLPQVCNEIRAYLIGTLSKNPGHFASSMGAVDIIVALHYVFDTPRDRIVFDVGHQAYAHKILTGRFADFPYQRTLHGISGFPNPHESEYDTFVCGHAGNSISAALGMAIADKTTPGETDRKTVALIGDASISNGLAFEGLNNTSQHPNDLLIVLNDNEMSIDDNVGALHRYLSNLTTTARYNRIRYRIYNKLRAWGLINEKGKRSLIRFNNALKSLVAKQQNIFEGLDIRYFGPFNGHDVVKMVKVLRDIKEMHGPRILHLHTKKGKGFDAAEQNPAPWHAPGKFNPETALRQIEMSPARKIMLWQEVMASTLVNLAEKDERIVGITAGMLSGTSMKMMEKFPGRLFDVGISEGHAVTFAGGLAAAGKRPFVAIYSSFLQRAYDNIIHDVAIQGLPVTFCIDRAGIVGEDGVTHHGVFDLAYLRIVPGLLVAAPMDAVTLRNLMLTSLNQNSTMAIRYPRGKSDAESSELPIEPIPIGVSRVISENDEARIALLSVGPVGFDAMTAIELVGKDVPVSHYDMIWIKPLDEELLQKVAQRYEQIITIEDGTVSGGFGSAVEEWLNDNGYSIPVTRLGIPDNWVGHGSVAELKSQCGYDVDSIANVIKSLSNHQHNKLIHSK